MNTYLLPFADLPAIEEIQKQLQSGKRAALAGVSDAEKAHVIFGIGHEYPVKLIVTFDELRARALYEEYSFFEPNTVYYPGKDLLFYQSDIHGNALTGERIRALQAILSGKPVTLVTTIDALMNKLPPRELFAGGIITVSADSIVSTDTLRKSLVAMGYENTSQVEQPGEFAVRGGIIDIYTLTEEHPVRIELWGDEVDSIRLFDVSNQRSIESLNSVTIYPAMELVLNDAMTKAGIKRIREDADALTESYRKQMKTEEAYHLKTMTDELLENLENGWSGQNLETQLLYFCDETASLLDYLPKDTVLFLDQISHLSEKAETITLEFSDSMSRRLEKGYVLPKQIDIIYPSKVIKSMLRPFPAVLLSTLEGSDDVLKASKKFTLHAVQGTSFNNSFPLLVKELTKHKKNRDRVMLISPSRTRAKHLADDLLQENLNAFFTEDEEHGIEPGEILVTAGRIRRGFSYPEASFVLICESDIFGAQVKKKRAKRKYEGEKIAGFRDLHVGDYVVHENHGLGIYRGIEKIEIDHIMKDYIRIEYAKNSNLYIAATALDMIQKYSDADGKKPKLNTLGGKEWKETRAKVQSSVGVVAKELVELYAHRQEKEGFVYSEDTVWQKEFEETFPYVETESQLNAIEEVKADMMSKKIMDRLICGDVGYGKTEIAIRAAFKAVQDGKQVVFLAPTTILAEQHYSNFIARMKNYPVNIGLLCRFRTEAEQKETIKNLKSGLCDIVIGTHRVLSKDVKFKDLGLLIIDEEQRFGVNHKEKIKQIRENVDVISLTATPIPRTLHMSLIGIRDMTVLEEAPVDRMPIQTFVFEYNEEMIREAVVREMARGGQVYYVINRIKNIADVAARIEALIPEANIAYIHGRMNENTLERIMYDFINREIDVLIATTIIEIGLDISNVNTIIIHDADQLGLSQLYQLRGRVGRSNRTAYAFLMYKKDKMLKEVAEKRLSAIREFTELGSGFKIAMRDLEIRGAGNLLGKEQHGHMAAVGYDLYCKMLNTAVLKEKGDEAHEHFETTVEMDIDAFIPEKYIRDEMLRLDIYKRIAGIETEEDRDEMLDELLDRFGEPPKSVMNLLLIALIKMEANHAFITLVSQKGEAIKFVVKNDAPIDPSGIPELVGKHAPYYTFTPDPGEPYFTFSYKKDNRLDLRQLPEYVRNFILDFRESCVRKSG